MQMTMPLAEPILALREVSRQFGGVAALDRVSLTVSPGEILCLLGPSGCGKSTLLRLIAGVDRPDGGEIRLAGAEVAGPARFVEPEARRIGFMFQDYALFPHLTVAQNVAFGLAGTGRAAVAARTAEVLEIAGVSALAGRHPHELSGGEQQRVALARALAPRPALLLMDEPFSNLDQGLRETVRAETLRLLRDLGTTAVMVTHDPQEALATGDRLAVMRAGRIEAEGTPRQLYRAPPSLYVAQFLGPGKTLAGRVAGGRMDSPLGPVPAPPGLPDGPAVLFLRPQDIRPAAEGAAAVVRSVSFQGESERVTALLDSTGAEVVLHLPAGQPLRAGQRVALALRGPALVFADLAATRVAASSR